MVKFGILGADGQPRYSGWMGTPPVDPDPDPDPGPTGPFTHGSQVFRWNVGRPDGYYPQDTRTALATPPVVAGRTYTSADSNSTVSNIRFTQNVVVAAGCNNITFKYCVFDTPNTTAPTQYVFVNDGVRVYFEDCTFIGKYGGGKTLYQRSTGGMYLKKCLVLGSQDVYHAGPSSAVDYAFQPFAVACTDFTGARLVIEDSFLGDGVRAPGGHIDNMQFDVNDVAQTSGNAIIKRSKLFAYSVTAPNAPRTTQGDPTVPSNAVLILSKAGTSGNHGKFSLEKCQMDGGNFTINGGSDASVMAIRDCTLGGDGTFVFQGRTCFGASRYGSGFGSGPTRVNNTFAKTGTYVKIDNETTRPPTFYNVTAGQPVNI